MIAQQQSWAANVIEHRPIERLVPNPRNARSHSEEQVRQIAAAITEFGWTNPVLIDEAGLVLAGHGRLLGARRLGLATVPVIVARGWTDEQKRIYSLADNKIMENGEWNKQLLQIEIGDLKSLIGASLSIGLTGFSTDEIDAMLAKSAQQAREADPDYAVPELPATAAAARGEVWILDKHRLLCGDATSAADVQTLLAGAKPNLMVTDPPYGVEYDPGWRNKAGISHSIRVGKVANDDRADWRAAWKLFPGNIAYVWHAGLHASVVEASLEAVEFEMRAQIVWAKDQMTIGRGNYHWQHEPCWYAVRIGAKANWQGGRKQTTVWEIPVREDLLVHGTQKPVDCMQRPIENNSRPGDLVYDPFLGSGTTLIAATIAGREALAMEIDPRYVDLAIKRWQEFTKGTARLQGSGRTFAEIAAERLPPPQPQAAQPAA